MFARRGRVLREGLAVTYRMIQRCRDAFPVRLMCRCLRGSLRGSYGWVTREPSARARENARSLTRIRHLHADQDGVVGSPRIWEALRYAGEWGHIHGSGGDWSRCNRRTSSQLNRP